MYLGYEVESARKKGAGSPGSPSYAEADDQGEASDGLIRKLRITTEFVDRIERLAGCASAVERREGEQPGENSA